MISGLKSAVVCAIVALTPFPAHAAPDAQCLAGALAMGDTRHEVYLFRRAAETTAMRPDLKEIAHLQAEVMQTGFFIFFSRRNWLWQTQPERFVNADAFFAFGSPWQQASVGPASGEARGHSVQAHVVWEEQDQVSWIQADARNAELVAQWIDLRERLETHADAEAYRAFLATARGEKRFLQLAIEQSAASSTDRAAVAACF